MIINPATAELLNASAGDQISAPGTTQPISVTTVADGQFTTGIGSVPVALVHLSELQQMTSVTDSDAADQILVSTNAAGVQSDLEDQYPNTAVVTRTGVASQAVSTSSLPLAMAAAAFVTALVVGVLFTATMMGLEVSTDRTTLGTLTALGYSGRSLTVLVIAETLSLAVVGGILGVGFGGLATLGVNVLARRLFGVESLAVFEPALLGYGLAVAFIIGICAAPYPIWLSRRTDPLEVIRR
jgi:putative ABC transport system permease protein